MRRLTLALSALVLALAVVAGASATTLNLVAYSTPKPVMAKIISGWQATGQGEGVDFSQSYGPSTNQAKAVIAGQPADLVFLSAGDDVNSLVDAGLVNQNWSQQGYNGIAANTVVVFAVRDGNPKHIKGWDDLLKPGVQVVTPNPYSSGSAKWNILAAYGAQRRLGKTDAQATAYVQKLFSHVVSQDTSGSNATNTFLSGKGDVLLTYESEAINARLNGQGHPVRDPAPDDADPAPDRGAPEELEQGPREQVHPVREVDAGAGALRPVRLPAGRARSSRRSRPRSRSSRRGPGIFKIDDKIIGGWRQADKVWFDPNNGRMAKIERAVGGPTSG